MNEAVEALDDDLRASIAASLPSPLIEYVEPPAKDSVITVNASLIEGEEYTITDDDGRSETIDVVEALESESAGLRYRVTEKPAQPKLNRAQRRRLVRTVTRKARRQARKATQRESRDIRELRGKRCPRCNLLFIGRAKWRCQCKAVSANEEKAEAQ